MLMHNFTRAHRNSYTRTGGNKSQVNDTYTKLCINKRMYKFSKYTNAVSTTSNRYFVAPIFLIEN